MAENPIFDSRTIYNFWAKVDRSGGPDACWPWLGADGNTRGSFCVQRKQFCASHIALILDGRPKPLTDGIMALHGDTCLKPNCTNPRHLRWSDHNTNMADMLRLGRQAKGVTQWKAKLTDEIVAEMRRSTDGNMAWARRLGINYSTVERARRGITWKHVADHRA